jgi:hypothetical protein
MKWCLHKHDHYVDITTYSDYPNAVLLCLGCDGYRYKLWRSE